MAEVLIPAGIARKQKTGKNNVLIKNLSPEIIASDRVLYFFNDHFKMKHSVKYDFPCFLKLFLFSLGNLAEQLGSGM